MTSGDDRILYRQVRSVKAGQSHRFKIHYTPQQAIGDGMVGPSQGLWVKVKNVENIALRAAFLAGPYVLYVDCKLEEYDSNKPCFITADQPVFEPQLLPGQSFYAQLSCHTIKHSYCWIVDVISQIVFNNTIDVDFEILIGTSKEVLHNASLPEKKVLNHDKVGTFAPSTLLNVLNQDTLDLWNLPVPDLSKPIHLVILSHGLHSNVSADMLYLKEQIDSNNNENVVVKGFFGNVGKTERGIKYLGSRIAEYIVDLVTNNETLNNGKIDRISFIGHSLGGLVQTFAIAYLHVNFPSFFKTIRPVNFITLSSPLLGIVNENPVYVKLALSAGIVGKTGRDLGLKFLESDSKPLLLLIPSGPTHQVLKRFVRRTVYANAINDGIVPLRTSSLLFLDYKGLIQIVNATDEKQAELDAINERTGNIPLMLDFSSEGTWNKPMQAMLSYFMPHKQAKKSDVQYQRFQTSNSEGKSEDREGNDNQGSEFEDLPVVSVLETATSLILPPLPSLKYITNPESRDNVIVHDKIYTEKDLPPKNQPLAVDANGVVINPEARKSPGESYSTSIKNRILRTIDYDVEHLEEEIAREYHKNMSWRKVVVKLKPDAHNNIIVRRRFANAYGWPVIEHLVKNHFGQNFDEPADQDAKDVNMTDAGSESAPRTDESALKEDKAPSSDSLDDEVGLSLIVSRDLITRENEEIDQSKRNEDEVCEHQWINSNDNAESLFAVGPTGLLSEVTEMVGNIRDQFYNYGLNQETRKSTERKESGSFSVVQNTAIKEESKDSEYESNESFGLAKRVMGGFI
ncbi:putative serine esterase-domain-containing protein [Scheffersomyces xylosifermentans]|uniref:putative serine esterase-domain-containing protein n=1 Tax=Scheffersomyces xylosifermentans TaxID=1304137 RepID=UPI00315CBB0D